MLTITLRQGFLKVCAGDTPVLIAEKNHRHNPASLGSFEKNASPIRRSPQIGDYQAGKQRSRLTISPATQA
jgi:hypothetical protein